MTTPGKVRRASRMLLAASWTGIGLTCVLASKVGLAAGSVALLLVSLVGWTWSRRALARYDGLKPSRYIVRLRMLAQPAIMLAMSAGGKPTPLLALFSVGVIVWLGVLNHRDALKVGIFGPDDDEDGLI